MKKRSSHDRGGLRSSSAHGSGHERRSSPKPDEEVVYRQTALQMNMDSAPEPSVSFSVDRHAVSAADLMNQSMSNMTTTSNQSAGMRGGTQSFVLHGSANKLSAVKAGNGPTSNRRKSDMLGGSSHNSTSSRERGDSGTPVQKRSIYAPAKEMVEQVKLKLPSLRGEEDVSDDDNVPMPPGGAKKPSGEFGSDSDSSADSYDANVMGAGKDENGKRLILRKQSSVSKGGYQGGSVADLSNVSDDYDDEEDDFQGSVSSYEEEDGPFHCCGIRAPQLRCIRLNRIASCVVRFAPCFWCFPIPISATDRTILTRLNIISAFLTVGQVMATGWLVIVMLIPPSEDSSQDDNVSFTKGMEPNLWSLTGAMYSVGFFGAVILVTNIVTLKVIQVVNLVGAIRYLWVLLYLLPFEIFFVASLFDFYDVTSVWVKHWWLVPSMAWFRDVYCAPGTANSLCMVPQCLESTTCETEWCLINYAATNCTEIRDAAQVEVQDLMNLYYNTNFVWGIILILVLFLIVSTLERIISKPMVQKSRESNVPAWLSLPFFGCSVVGAVFRYSESSVLNANSGSTYSWVGTAYMCCGVLFLISACLGWFISTFSILSSRDKRYKHISVLGFIFLMGVTSFILTVIFVASISYSVALVEIPISPSQKHEIACGVDTADSCSNCNGEIPGEPKCPEWTLEDVTSVLQTQTKGSATLALIFFLYSFSALRFGFVLRKHVTMYQIDYV